MYIHAYPFNWIWTGFAQATSETTHAIFEKYFLKIIWHGNCKNCFEQWELIKRKNALTALNLLSPGCYMASADWKDAYCFVPILMNHRKYLIFQWVTELFSLLVTQTAWPQRLAGLQRSLKLSLLSYGKHISVQITFMNVCSWGHPWWSRKEWCTYNIFLNMTHNWWHMPHQTLFDKVRKKLYTQHLSQHDTELLAHATSDPTCWLLTLKTCTWHRPTFNLHLAQADI